MKNKGKAQTNQRKTKKKQKKTKKTRKTKKNKKNEKKAKTKQNKKKNKKKQNKKKGAPNTERKKKDKANGAEGASVFFRLLLACEKIHRVFRRVTSFRTHLTLLRTMSALSMTTAVAARVSIAGKSVASKRNATASPSKRGQLVRAQFGVFFVFPKGL